MKRPGGVASVVLALLLAWVPLWVGTTAASAGVTQQATSWSRVSVGASHTCALGNDASLWCWGGADGASGSTSSMTPVRVGSATTWTDVDAGWSSSCALRRNHSLWCWGLGFNGRLGTGNRDDRPAPTRVGQDLDWALVSTFYSHTCATKLDGTLWCWGERTGTGTGATGDVLSPRRVGVARWSSVSAGYEYSCGVRSDGALFCWGANGYGQLGIGSTSPRVGPTRVGAASDWTKVSAGFNHTCGLRADRSLHCWGGGIAVGDGTGELRTRPAPVGAARSWTDVTVGSSHACARDLDGALWCWGFNANGQLGIGTRATSLLPARITTPSRWAGWTPISAGWNSTCAINPVGSLWCWGENVFGMLGDGTRTDRTRPTRVSLPTA